MKLVSLLAVLLVAFAAQAETINGRTGQGAILMVGFIWDFLGRYAAEVIAACALFFTAYEAITARRHNVRSVTPHLTTFTHRNKSPGQGILAVRLMNNGVGPAFIRSFKVLLDGKQVTDLDAALEEVLKGRSYDHTITTLGNDYAMSAGEVRDLLVVRLPLREGEGLEDVEKQLTRFDLVIDYASIYRKMKPIDTRKNRAPLSPRNSAWWRPFKGNGG